MAQSDYTAAVLEDSPYSFWKMNESSGLPQDSSGNGRHLTGAFGIILFRQGAPFPAAQSIKYASSGVATAFHSIGSFSTVTDDFTIEFWIKAPNNVNTSFLGYSDTVNAWNIGYSLSSVRTIAVYSADTQQDQILMNAYNGFTHTVVQRSAGTWIIYFNGVLFDSNIGTTTPTIPASTFSLGDFRFTDAQDTYLSNVSFYETVLSASRIYTHYVAAITSQPDVYGLAGRGAGW